MMIACGMLDTPFKQQKLKAWQPILTPNWVIGTFAVVGLIFIPIGIILLIESQNVSEHVMLSFDHPVSFERMMV